MGASYQAAFNGKVEQNEYVQVYDFQTYEHSDAANTYRWRELVTQKVVEKIYRFSGLSYSNAHSTTAVTVSDASGHSHSVPMASGFRDGSTGDKVFEVYSCNVIRQPMSPHLWEVTVKVRESEYFVNGEKINLPNA